MHDIGALPMPDGTHMLGASIGSGHRLARELGYRTGAPAVGCAVDLIVREVDRRGVSADVAAAMIEHTVLHELAHSLTNIDRDGVRPAAILEALSPGSMPVITPAASAAAHNGRWAAVLLVLTDRAVGYRPRHARMLTYLLACDVAGHGHSDTALRRIVGQVDADRPVRELLADHQLIEQLRLAGRDDHTQHAAAASRDAVAACTFP